MSKNVKKVMVFVMLVSVLSVIVFPVFSAVVSYVLNVPNYQIKVDGNVYTNTELPILNMSGRTYIPLKSVGDLLGANIAWNEKDFAVEITKNTPKPTQTSDGLNIVYQYNNQPMVWFDDIQEKYLDRPNSSGNIYSIKSHNINLAAEKGVMQDLTLWKNINGAETYILGCIPYILTTDGEYEICIPIWYYEETLLPILKN